MTDSEILFSIHHEFAFLYDEWNYRDCHFSASGPDCRYKTIGLCSEVLRIRFDIELSISISFGIGSPSFVQPDDPPVSEWIRGRSLLAFMEKRNIDWVNKRFVVSEESFVLMAAELKPSVRTIFDMLFHWGDWRLEFKRFENSEKERFWK